MKIEVTQSDIDNGIPISASRCPIAQACKRAINNGCFVTVTVGGGVKVYNSLEQITQQHRAIPQSVKQFILDFDHGIPVSPFTFELKD